MTGRSKRKGYEEEEEGRSELELFNVLFIRMAPRPTVTSSQTHLFTLPAHTGRKDDKSIQPPHVQLIRTHLGVISLSQTSNLI